VRAVTDRAPQAGVMLRGGRAGYNPPAASVEGAEEETVVWAAPRGAIAGGESVSMPDRLTIARNWLPRYTGMALDEFGEYVLLTNFGYYVHRFAERFGCDVKGENRPMQAASNSAGLTLVNFGIGSPNAA